MVFYGFPGGSVVKNPPANAGDVGLIPALGRFHWRRIWHPTPVFLPGKSQGQRSLEDYGPWGHKEPNTTQWPNKTTTATSDVLKFSCFSWLFTKVNLCCGLCERSMTTDGFLIFFLPFCSCTEYEIHQRWGMRRAEYLEMLIKLWLLAMKEYDKCAHNTNITFMEV